MPLPTPHTALATAASLLLAVSVSRAQFTALGDLNPGPDNSESFDERTAVGLGDAVVFVADDGGTANGTELWRTDGTAAGTQLLLDINPGVEGSEPSNLFRLRDGLVVFVADDGVHGRELWRTDGTAAGTRLVRDANPGPGDGAYDQSSADFAVIRGVLYYTGLARSRDFEPWRSDGTEAGTYQIGNLGFDQGTFISGSFPEAYASFDGDVYVGSREGLHRLPAGDTALVEVLPAAEYEPFHLDSLSVGLVVFSRPPFGFDADIFVTQGDTASTQLVGPVPREIQYTLNNVEPFAARLGDRLYFPGSTTAVGVELFATDGTPGGTGVFADLNPATDDGYPPQNKLVHRGYLYYKYDDGDADIELWRTDGTAAGTERLTDINANGASFFLPSTVDAVGDYVVFKAGTAFRQRPFAYNVTTGALVDGADALLDRNASPSDFVAFGDSTRAFFFAEGAGDVGREPFVWEVGAMPSAAAEPAGVLPVAVRPNPSRDQVRLDLPAGRYDVEILDALGRVVLRRSDHAAGAPLSLTAVPAGRYEVVATPRAMGGARRVYRATGAKQ